MSAILVPAVLLIFCSAIPGNAPDEGKHFALEPARTSKGNGHAM
jgi:hypothetical protein